MKKSHVVVSLIISSSGSPLCLSLSLFFSSFYSCSVRCCVWQQKCLLMFLFSSAHFVDRNLVNVSFPLVSFFICWSVAIVLQFPFIWIFIAVNKCKLCAIIEFHEFWSSLRGHSLHIFYVFFFLIKSLSFSFSLNFYLIFFLSHFVDAFPLPTNNNNNIEYNRQKFCCCNCNRFAGRTSMAFNGGKNSKPELQWNYQL